MITENKLLHKSGTGRKLYIVAMEGLPLSSQIFIQTSTFVFDVIKCPPETSMYLSLSESEPGTKSDISGVR